MNEKTNRKQRILLVLTIFAVMVWVSVPLVDFFSAKAGSAALDCPNGPLRADLTGAATGGKTPRGTAQYKERNNNSLMVMVRSVNVADGTTLNVFVGDTNVGQITVPRSGNGQLKVDSPTATIAEGTAITVRHGDATVLSGTFACVAGGRTSPSPTATVTASPTVSPTVSPTISPTISPTESPTVSPTVTPTASPTPTQTP